MASINKPQYQSRPIQQSIPYQMKKAPYPNRVIDDNLVKGFYGKLLSGNIGEIKDFLESNPLPINMIRDDNRDTPLHIILKIDNVKLSEKSKVEICNYLLSKGTSINTYNKQDLSPLMIACQYQLPEVVELLLRYGGNVKSTNAYHQNPLHIAVQPKLTFCPQFNSTKLVANPDTKYRDVNNISKAVNQYLLDGVDIQNLSDTNVKQYPLNAIKNILDNSYKYMTIYDVKDETINIFEEVKNKYRTEVEKILNTNNFTKDDKKANIRELFATLSKNLIDKFKGYYEGIDMFENISLNDNGLKEDNLTYIDLIDYDKDSVVFGYDKKNYLKVYNDIMDNLDGSYDLNMANIGKLLNDCKESITNIYNAINKLNIFNNAITHYQTNMVPPPFNELKDIDNFAMHQYLNSLNVNYNIYGEKYQFTGNEIQRNYYDIDKYLEVLKETFKNEQILECSNLNQYTYYNGIRYISFNAEYLCGSILIEKIQTPDPTTGTPVYDDRLDNFNAIKIKHYNDRSEFEINFGEINKKKQFTDKYQTIYVDDRRYGYLFLRSFPDVNYIVYIYLWQPKNIQYYTNTAIVDTFNNKYYTHILSRLNILRNDISEYYTYYPSISAAKYNYYNVYNLINIINYTIDEYVSYLIFILNEQSKEGLNLNYYKQYIGKPFFPSNAMEILNNNNDDNGIFDIIESEKNKLDRFKKDINKYVNNITSILNIHQNTIINYHFSKKLLLNKNFFDRNSYKLTYKNIFDDKTDVKFSVNGLMNNILPKLPTININEIVKIDVSFFMKCRPNIDGNLYYITKDTYNNEILNNYYVSNYNKISTTTNKIHNLIGTLYSTPGKLFLIPWTNKNNIIDVVGYTKFFRDPNIMFRPPLPEIVKMVKDKMMNSMYIATINYNNTADDRYDIIVENGTLNDNIGLIGIIKINDPPKLFNPEIDLLDKNKLPFNITNSDLNILNKDLKKDAEVISLLKRVFIASILEERNSDIYTTKTKPTGKTNIFGPNNNLFETIKNIIINTKMIYDSSNNKETNLLTNKLISKITSKIISKNITNYLTILSSVILNKLLLDTTNIDKVDLSSVLMQTNNDIPNNVDFSDLTDYVYDIIENRKLDVNLDLVDPSIMELSNQTINIFDYTYNIPTNEKTISTDSNLVEYKNKENMIYFKREYLQNDNSVFDKNTILCYHNDIKIIDILIKNGVEINAGDYWQKTPLMYAIENRNLKILSRILKIPMQIYDYVNNSKKDVLKLTILQEVFHQRIFYDERENTKNKLILIDNYKTMLENIFNLNMELRKNMPKNIEIINYLPIYLLNNDWNKTLNFDRIKIQDLVNRYFENEKFIIGNGNFYFLSNNEITDNVKVIINNNYSDLMFDNVIKKIKTKIDKYNQILSSNIYSDPNRINEIKSKIDNLTEKIKNIKDLSKNSSFNISGIDKYDVLLNPALINTNIYDFINKLDKDKYRNFILSTIIKFYHQNETYKYGENIHLVLTNLYSKYLESLTNFISLSNKKLKSSHYSNFLLFKNKVDEYKSDLNIIETNFEILIKHLDERYNENFKSPSNIIVKEVFNSIAHTILIAVQSNFVLGLRKIIVLHLINTVDVSLINILLDNIMNKLVDDNGLLSINMHENNLSYLYTQNSINLLEEENVEYNSFDQFVKEIREHLLNNGQVTIDESSELIKMYDKQIIPYFRVLYRETFYHQYTLIQNYIKFIHNQYNGIKILKMILDKITE
jgi:hypothetical protein